MAEKRSEADSLLAGLREQLEAYRKVEAYSTDELNLVREAELEKATAVLAKKQEALATVATVEARIAPLKAKWPEMKALVPADIRLSFQEVLGGLSALLERLIALERETEEVLTGQIAVVRKAAPAISAEGVRKAYGVRPEGKKKD